MKPALDCIFCDKQPGRGVLKRWLYHCLRWRAITITLLVFSAFGCARSIAQELSADDIIFHMDGICIQNILQIDTVGAMAILMEAAAVPKELAVGLAPIDGELLGAWHFQADDHPFFFATAQNAHITPPTSSCSLVTTFHDPDEIIERFKSIYDVSSSKEDRQGFQHYTMYEIIAMGEKMVIIFNQGLHPSTKHIISIGAVWPIE